MSSTRLVRVLLSILALLPASAAKGHPASGGGGSTFESLWSRLPLRFEANEGQLDAGALFVSRGPGFNLSLTREGASLLFVEPARRGVETPETARPRARSIDLRLIGGNATSQVVGESPTAPANYFVGRDPSRWHRGVKAYRSVRYAAVYPGIDLVFHGRQGRLEYDFVVAPGADPARIELGVGGADGVAVNEEGALVVSAGGHSLVQPRPVLFQEDSAGRREIEGEYRIQGDRVQIAVGAYDRTLPLVIDPVFDYASYYGGSEIEELFGIDHDAQGNIWATGLTGSPNLPLAGALEAGYGGAGDIFVTKFDKNGQLLFSTYIGGRNFEQSWGMALDKAGNAYIVGNTKSTDFPVVGGIQSSLQGDRDAVLLKLDPTGSQLLFSTYLGGNGIDWGYAVDVDSKGAIYVAGETASTSFPVRSAKQATYGGGEDAFVTKLTSDGSSIVYSTYLGGGNHERAWGIKVDSSGRAYIAGTTASPNFPTVAAFQKRYGGGMSDGFMAQLSADGRKLLYSSFAGGTSTDQTFAVAVDGKGNARYVGVAGNKTFPVRQALQPNFGGGNGDGFVIGLTKTGGLQFSTLLGGSLADAAFSVGLDSKANIYVTGQTESPNFPLRSAVQTTLGGLRDGFLVKLRSDGRAFAYSTYFGGDAIDEGTVIDVDPSGRVYLGGFSDGNLPLVHAQQDHFGGTRDGFVARIQVDSQALAVSCAATARVLPGASDALVDIGLTTEVEGGVAPRVELRVFSDDGANVSDLEHPEPERLLLRAERSSAGSGRVYLIVASARDGDGKRGAGTCSVVVPGDEEAGSRDDVLSRAAAAENFFEVHRSLPVGFSRLDRPEPGLSEGRD
jgi:hypothetical protein